MNIQLILNMPTHKNIDRIDKNSGEVLQTYKKGSLACQWLIDNDYTTRQNNNSIIHKALKILIIHLMDLNGDIHLFKI